MLNWIWFSTHSIFAVRLKTGSKLSIKHTEEKQPTNTETVILWLCLLCYVKPTNTITRCYDLINIEHKPTKSFENTTGEFENENDTHETVRGRWQRNHFFPTSIMCGICGHSSAYNTIRSSPYGRNDCCHEKGKSDRNLLNVSRRTNEMSNEMVIFRFTSPKQRRRFTLILLSQTK